MHRVAINFAQSTGALAQTSPHVKIIDQSSLGIQHRVDTMAPFGPGTPATITSPEKYIEHLEQNNLTPTQENAQSYLNAHYLNSGIVEGAHEMAHALIIATNELARNGILNFKGRPKFFDDYARLTILALSGRGKLLEEARNDLIAEASRQDPDSEHGETKETLPTNVIEYFVQERFAASLVNERLGNRRITNEEVAAKYAHKRGVDAATLTKFYNALDAAQTNINRTPGAGAKNAH